MFIQSVPLIVLLLSWNVLTEAHFMCDIASVPRNMI